jgi:hypothetical protein
MHNCSEEFCGDGSGLESPSGMEAGWVNFPARLRDIPLQRQAHKAFAQNMGRRNSKNSLGKSSTVLGGWYLTKVSIMK